VAPHREVGQAGTMTALRLWPAEVEAMRAEARATVDAGSSFFPRADDADPDATVEELVARQRASHTSTTFTVPEGEELTIAGVRCRVFRPVATPRAVYLHFHGGGMIAGTPEMMDIPNRDLSREVGVAVVSADYRKAPEHPYPAAPDDGLAVASWLLDHAEAEFGEARLLVGGESAGAYLTAIVALRIRDELGSLDRVEGLNLTYGVYDWGRTPSQRGVRAQDGFDVLRADGVRFVGECYLPGMTDEERRAPQVSPAFADLHGLPPCFVSVGTCDHLLDDSLVFASRAAAAGVDVDLVVLPELPHAFQAFPCAMTKYWADRQADWIRARLASA
jgi:acetyl esterase